MFKSTGGRYLMVGFLTLAMFIPLFFASEVIRDRSKLSNQAINQISKEWGGHQTIIGPVLEIPVKQTVEKVKKTRVPDLQTGNVSFLEETYREEISGPPLFVLPNNLKQNMQMETEIRKRGIYEIPVFSVKADMNFDFDLSNATANLEDNEAADWTKARLLIGVNDNRSFTGETTLVVNGNELFLEPRDDASGLYAKLKNLKEYKGTFELRLGLNGAKSMYFTPAGRKTETSLTSDWPHPSFGGMRLPDDRQVSSEGFTANWSIPHFARAIPQISRENPEKRLHLVSYGTSFIQVTDFYQKAFRVGRYGILFVALTFMTILMMESRERPTHPVQYIFVGVAQVLFVILMVAYAEQIGFTKAYILASASTCTLLTLFGLFALQMGKKAFGLAGVLVTLNATLYWILQSEDFAFVAGATLAFAALALVMFMTRNEDWYGRVAILKQQRLPTRDEGEPTEELDLEQSK